MKNSDIIKYVKDYMEHDNLKGAIMLTGPWGIGKSFFIQNTLVPEINKKYKCVIVSLYGLEDVSEISKSVYFELRPIVKPKDSELKAAGAVIAKTIFRGITGHYGIDLKASDSDMKNLYDSINLKNKLIILEDLERCKIELIDLLGYVYSLVDQDGVKVLLVSNEDEILEYEEVEEKQRNNSPGQLIVNSNIVRRATQKTIEYLRVKEKTVCDTIKYEGDRISAIRSIIDSYDNSLLKSFTDDKDINIIMSIMDSCKSYNLRSFNYACQKITSIFSELPGELHNEYDLIKTIYYGSIIYVLKSKSGKNLSWGSEKTYSIALGSANWPLLRICYNYIVNQFLDLSNIDDVIKALKEKRIYDLNKSNEDKDIKIISEFYIHSETEVEDAVWSITNRLKKHDDIAYSKYGTIAVYLVYIENLLGIGTEEAKDLLVNNLKGRGDQLQPEQIFRTIMGDDATEKMRKEYNSLKDKMIDALGEGTLIIPNFYYSDDQTEIFCEYVRERKELFISNNGFARDLDIEKLAKMFLNCSSKQKNSIRGIFLDMYRSENIGQYMSGDKYSLSKLQEILKRDSEEYVGDKVDKLQCDYFISNLSDIIQKL